MRKVVNILLLVLIILFIFNVFKYYSSNKNIENTNFNRINVDKLLKSKINNLPILENDTGVFIKKDSLYADMKTLRTAYQSVQSDLQQILQTHESKMTHRTFQDNLKLSIVFFVHHLEVQESYLLLN